MSAKPWHCLPQVWPEDGETIWIRTPSRRLAPYQATFKAADQTFLPGGLSEVFPTLTPIPWWVIVEWREL